MKVSMLLVSLMAISPGAYVDPLSLAPELGTVIRPFAPPAQPWLPGHRGVDLAGRPGDPVYAAGEGVVAFAGVINHVGVVSIEHPTDGIRTTYQPVRAVVSTGDRVARGQHLGFLEHTDGLSFGVRRDARTYMDPHLLYRRPQIRLKPVDGPSGTPRPGGRN